MVTADPAGPDSHAELPVDPDAPGERPLHHRPVAAATVFLGGAVGTAARYGLEVLAPARSGSWPVGTFVANVAGAFVLGLLLEFLARAGTDDGWRRRARLLVGTGFCGGLTTYSTFAVETDLLVRDHSTALAIAYLLSTLVLGLAAAAAGIGVAARGRAARS